MNKLYKAKEAAHFLKLDQSDFEFLYKNGGITNLDCERNATRRFTKQSILAAQKWMLEKGWITELTEIKFIK